MPSRLWPALRRRRRLPPPPAYEEIPEDKWLIDRKVRLYRLYTPGIEGVETGGVFASEEWEAFEQFGAETQKVYNYQLVFKWSCIDICREMNNRGWHMLADDEQIAAEILTLDRQYRGSPADDGLLMPVRRGMRETVTVSYIDVTNRRRR